MGAIVADCVFDPSCDLLPVVCSYYGETISGPEDCFTCPDGSVFTFIAGMDQAPVLQPTMIPLVLIHLLQISPQNEVPALLLRMMHLLSRNLFRTIPIGR